MKVSIPTPCAHSTGIIAATLLTIGLLCMAAIFAI